MQGNKKTKVIKDGSTMDKEMKVPPLRLSPENAFDHGNVQESSGIYFQPGSKYEATPNWRSYEYPPPFHPAHGQMSEIDPQEGPSGLYNSQSESRKLNSFYKKVLVALVLITLLTPVMVIFEPPREATTPTITPTTTPTTTLKTTSTTTPTTTPTTIPTTTPTTTPTIDDEDDSTVLCVEGVVYIRKHFLTPGNASRYRILSVSHKINRVYVAVGVRFPKVNMMNYAYSLKDDSLTVINAQHILNLVADRKSSIAYFFFGWLISKFDFKTNTTMGYGYLYEYTVPQKVYLVGNLLYFIKHKNSMIYYISPPRSLFYVTDQTEYNFRPKVQLTTLDFVKTHVTNFAVIKHLYHYLYVTVGKLYQYKNKVITMIVAKEFVIAIDKYNVPALAHKQFIYKYDVATESLVPYATFNSTTGAKNFDFDKNNNMVTFTLDTRTSIWLPAPSDVYGNTCTVDTEDN